MFKALISLFKNRWHRTMKKEEKTMVVQQWPIDSKENTKVTLGILEASNKEAEKEELKPEEKLKQSVKEEDPNLRITHYNHRLH